MKQLGDRMLSSWETACYAADLAGAVAHDGRADDARRLLVEVHVAEAARVRLADRALVVVVGLRDYLECFRLFIDFGGHS